MQEARKVFERDEAEVGTSRTPVPTPSPRPTVEIPARVEISELREQITQTLKQVEEKINPPPSTPVVLPERREERIEEMRTGITQEELEERLRNLRASLLYSYTRDFSQHVRWRNLHKFVKRDL